MSRKTPIIIIASLAVLYGIYYWGIPTVLNSANFVDFAQQKISSTFPFKTEIKNPKFKMGLLPAIWVNADEVSVFNKNGSKALYLETPAVKISLLPLLVKKLHLANFSAKNSFAYLTLEKNSMLKLGDYPIVMNSNPKLPLTEAKIKLQDYKIYFHDNNQNKDAVIDGKLLHVKDYKKDKEIQAKLLSNIVTNGKSSELNLETALQLPLNRLDEDKIYLDANIKDLDLAPFSTYIKALSKGKYQNTKGILNLTASTTVQKDKHKKIDMDLKLDDFGLMNSDIAQSTYCDGLLEIQSTIKTLRNGVHFDKLTINAKNIDIAANGDVTKLNSKMPHLNLKVALNPSRAENIITLLPGYEKLLPEFNFYLLKKHIFYANAMGNIEIKGVANSPELFGKFLITDGYLIKRIPNTKEGAKVELSLNKRTMTLHANVATDPKEEVDINGTFKLFVDRRSDLRITSTKNINLAKAQEVILPLHNILKFEIGPAEMMTIGGFGNINLRAAGTKTEPHAWGTMNFHRAQAEFNDIHHVLVKNIEGGIVFNDRDVKFQTNNANLNNLPVKVFGKCSLAGGMDVTAIANNQDVRDFLKVIHDSPMLAELQEVVKPINTAFGKMDLYLNMTGNIKSGDEIVFNENLFSKGHVDPHSATITIHDFPAVFKDVSGRINFENNDGDFDVSTVIGNSKIYSSGTIKNKVINANTYSHKFNAGDGIEIASKLDQRIPYIKDLKSINTAFTSHYKGKADGIIHFDGLEMNGKIYNNRGSKQSIILNNNSTFNLKNLHLTVSPIRGTFKNNPFSAEKVEVKNMFSGKEIFSGNINFRGFDLAALNNFPELGEIYPQYKNTLKDFAQFNGKINIASKINDNKIRLFTQLNGTSVLYKPKRTRIKIQNGHILLNNDTLYLGNINSFVGRMPLYLSGKILNIQKAPYTDLYVNAKPNQEFFDQLFNNKSVYPIKLKGDVNCTSKIHGPLDNLYSKTELKLDENSTLYYMGAFIGDSENPVKIYLDSVLTPTYLKVNNFKYDKIITSQNNRDFANTQVVASGNLEFLDKNNLKFNNFRIKTLNPTDAKIFNVIFKKPLMKQGVFTSDLLINGTTLSPKILGQLDVTSIDVPFFEATVNDIHFDFKRNIVDIKSNANIMTNKITLNAQMLNNLELPIKIKDVKLHFDSLDLNKITQALQDYDADIYKQKIAADGQTKDFDPSNIIIQNGEITADTIKLKAIEATNFKANATLTNNMLFDVDNYAFDLAGGNVSGDLKYNLLNKKLVLNSQIKNSSAQTISESLFDLKGQLYGKVSGNMAFVCNGKSQISCMSTLSGNGDFEVSHGRMPKLGSLEYLLKAANLAKGGITGLSINGIIDLITPLKTGEFESISGSYIVDEGIARDINIYSKGKDLNLYLTGSYNIVNSIANMKVYGTLSNNITNVFGRLKNASLNTLLNTIPLLNKNELSPELEAEIRKIPNYTVNNNLFRIFAVDIDGDINGINYVKSFKWVK